MNLEGVLARNLGAVLVLVRPVGQRPKQNNLVILLPQEEDLEEVQNLKLARKRMLLQVGPNKNLKLIPIFQEMILMI